MKSLIRDLIDRIKRPAARAHSRDKRIAEYVQQRVPELVEELKGVDEIEEDESPDDWESELTMPSARPPKR